jgi:hypothetical protein
MLQDANLFDAWTQIIDVLASPGRSRRLVEASIDRVPPVPIRRNPAEGSPSQCEPFVRVIDRPTALTLTIDWRDATKCCYREQLWVAAHARVSGRCALSGEAILPGDEIFRPRRAGPAPRNVGAMVLATAVEACGVSVPAPAAPMFSGVLGAREWGAVYAQQPLFNAQLSTQMNAQFKTAQLAAQLSAQCAE